MWTHSRETQEVMTTELASREWGAAIKNSKVLVVVPCTDQGHKVRIRCTQSRHVESWVPLPHSPTCTAGVRH